jgi:hypothetical protein
MSQSGGSQHRTAAQGPYGPDNPPPPPPGKPDKKRGHPHDQPAAGQDSPPMKSPGRAYLHRKLGKLNSRQRKKRREEQAASNPAEARHRSRSPSRASQGSSTLSGRSPEEQVDNQEIVARSSNRQSLRDVRQYTPDKTTDKIYERLSPREAFRNARHGSYDQVDLRFTKRTDWPDEPPNLSFEAILPVPMDNELQGRKDLTSDERESSPESLLYKVSSQYDREKSFVPRNKSQEPDWTSERRPNSPDPFSGAHSNQNFDIQEEVAWDDNGTLGMNTPIHASTSPNAGYRRPYEAAYDRKPYPKTQSAAHTASPSHKRDWKRRTWEDNHNQGQRAHFQAQRGPNIEQHPPQAPFAKSRKNARDAETFDRRQGFATEDRQDSQTRANTAKDHLNNLKALMRTNPPESMYNLRKYDAHITEMHNKLPRNQAYRNGNGKAAPHTYGSAQGPDLGLCFVTFCTNGWCEMGVKCAWRHHPLTKAEREWILANGHDRGKGFLEKLPKNWSSPEIPVPGASMHDK